jgi:UTP--glucose-1-phosphate uridylyltransferase
MTSSDPFQPFADKMTAAGMKPPAIRAFEANYRALLEKKTGLIPEGAIEPVQSLPCASELPAVSDSEFQSLLRQTVIIKLNGGLGTGMGLEKAKSLLSVREGLTFLDLIAQQIIHLREQAGGGTAPRFLLMNSFATSSDTREFLEKYRDRLGDPQSLEFVQSMVPKVRTDTLAPLDWPADPDLEWCPPGHGDLYPSLESSDCLDALLADGIRFAFVSNSDNLGATLDPKLLGHFAHSGVPFLMEVTARTEADKKGGHLAAMGSKLILRESAQCPKEDQKTFEDVKRHRYFNTNNLWIRLDHLKQTLETAGGIIPLPMIRNSKTADPRDKHSRHVYQLETAMGAAIESFTGARAINVDRSRFAPVKTTSDLLIIRSDACRLTHDSRLELIPERAGVPPTVKLDDEFYKMVDGLDKLTARGLPSLRECRSLTIKGAAVFEPGVVLEGDVKFVPDVKVISAGRYGAA